MFSLKDNQYQNLAQNVFGDTIENDFIKCGSVPKERDMLKAIYFNNLKWGLYEWLFTKRYRIDAEVYSKLFDERSKDSDLIKDLLKDESEGDHEHC